MFGIIPSVYGISASVIFLLMALLQWQKKNGAIFSNVEDWSITLGFALLGIGFLIKYIPKFVIFSFINFIAHPITFVGLLLMALYFFTQFGMLTTMTTLTL